MHEFITLFYIAHIHVSILMNYYIYIINFISQQTKYSKTEFNC